MTSPLRPEDPRVLGRYELIGRLGEGGVGSVFLGRDPLERLVAVKVIRAEYARAENFRARFRSEVNRAREVPAFCTAEVLDANPEHATPYLVVEFVDGPSLPEVIQDRGPLRGGNLHSVAVGVASALVAIHSAGIVHRDLKPANVLFALVAPKVIDFGIAKAVEATSHHTQTQEMVGTLAYMSPEVDLALSPAADIFAWGALVAYAATGRNPFAGDSPVATAGRIRTQPPLLAGVPAGLVGIVGRALAKDPGQRPTGWELLLELTAGRDDDATVPVEVHRAVEGARGIGRSRRRWYPAAAVVVLLAVGGAWVGTRLARDEKRGEKQDGTTVAAAASSTAVRQSAKELFDPLTTARLWSPFGAEGKGCAFDDGLVIETTFSLQCESGPHRIGVDVVRSMAQVSVDGRTILTGDLSRGEASGARHTSGRVALGASVGGGGPAVTVVLRDLHVTVD